MPTRSWLTNLTTVPAPDGPTWWMFLPSASKTAGPLEHLGLAADHEGQRGALGTGGTAAHRPVQEADTLGLGRLIAPFRGIGTNRRAINEDLPGTSVRDQTVVAEVDALDLLDRRQRREHDLGGRDNRGLRRGRLRALGG